MNADKLVSKYTTSTGKVQPAVTLHGITLQVPYTGLQIIPPSSFPYAQQKSINIPQKSISVEPYTFPYTTINFYKVHTTYIL
jgi:hypothetical protein